MSLTKPTLGVLYSPQLQIDPLRNYLRTFGKVRIVDYTDTGIVDILFIPHGGGLYPGLPCFKDFATSTGMCPEVEHWRIHRLEEIIKKDIPIIGIGDGCALLYQKAGGDIRTVNGELRCIPNDSIKSIDDGLFVTSFRDEYHNFYGFYKFDVAINRFILDYTESLNNDSEPDQVLELLPLNPIKPAGESFTLG